jgi:A/G-specific adenine glycosylase
MMELGALVCRRHDPGCGACPVRRFCAAAHLKAPEDYPRLMRKKTRRRAVARAWCEDNGRLLLHRAASGGRRLAGLHELPAPAELGLDDATVRAGPLLARKKRGFTNHQITESIHAVRLTGAQRRRLAANAALRWVPRAELDLIILSGPHRRWVEEILTRIPAVPSGEIFFGKTGSPAPGV